ncbi:MAG: alkaline phosphatase family protein [Dehalococcoidia bacterium]
MSGFRQGSWLSRLGVLAIALAMLGMSGAPPAAVVARPAVAQDENVERIKRIVVIYLENHSFDNLYGVFPGANGLASAADAQRFQVDKQGQPYGVLPAPLAAPVGGRRDPDPRFPTDLAPAPFLLNLYLSFDEPGGDLIHAFYREQYQIDGGSMTKFAAWSDAAGLAMGYWDAAGLPLYELAKEYTVADNFFHAAFGGSFLNHFWLVCGCTPTWPDAPADVVAVPFPDDAEHLQDRAVSPDGFAVNTAYTVNAPHPATVAADHLLPNQTMPTIGDRLSDAGISWAWYAGGWNDALAGRPDPLFQFHHQPFAYFARYADGTAEKDAHLKDEQDFFTALQQGTLPAVSFIKPLGPDNEHPRYAALRQGEEHAAQIIRAIQQSPFWAETAIIVTYDEHGGYWDHVAPPVVDHWGPGLRVPTIVISPFAKRGYVDHTQYDTTSILALIERRWGLAPLAARDASVSDLLAAFDFSQSP